MLCLYWHNKENRNQTNRHRSLTYLHETFQCHEKSRQMQYGIILNRPSTFWLYLFTVRYTCVASRQLLVIFIILFHPGHSSAISQNNVEVNSLECTVNWYFIPYRIHVDKTSYPVKSRHSLEGLFSQNQKKTHSPDNPPLLSMGKNLLKQASTDSD